MFYVLFFLVAGILVGVMLHKRTWLPSVSEKVTTIAIFLLLFTLGIKAGADRSIMGQLDTLGLTALGISMFALAGSVVVGWIVYVYFFKKQKL